MKPIGCLVFFSLYVSISGAAVHTNINGHNEEDEYRLWGKFPWDQPGNPPPFAPPDDFFPYSQIEREWAPSEQDSEKLRPLSADSQGDTSEEYSSWHKYPWQRPGNPPPFMPPGDTQFSQIGRWWVKDDQEGNQRTPYSQIGRWWNRDYLEGKTGRFDGTQYSQIGRWWNKDYLEGKSQRFTGMPYSQIGRWWNQDYLEGKPEKMTGLPIMDGDATAEYGAWGKFPWEKPDSPLPLVPPGDQQLSRSRRSLRPVKPWQKPWNPPPILPEPYPPTDY